MFATSVFHRAYGSILKPLFFRRDPETVHDRMMAIGKFIGRFAFLRAITKALFSYSDPVLEQNILGIRFANPVGLSAGFDKNAELVDVISNVGFGFEEVGSITGEPCAGNAKPRLWRLPKSKGLVVYYGLKNDGCEAISNRLRGRDFDFPIGISVAKTNDASTVGVQAGIADYAKAFRAFTGIGAYFTINISCPNAFGGEPFSDPQKLDALLAVIDAIPSAKPIFIKMPADITTTQLDALVEVADKHRVHGFILSNLTKNRTRPEIDQLEIQGIDKGGISGKPVAGASNQLIAHLFKTRGKQYVIVGVGGVFSAQDAYEKIKHGASLIQLITGMIFEGPQLIGKINHDLAELIRKDGYKNISEAVGTSS